MKTIRTVLLASGAALLLSTGIAAAAPGTARTDLNVRSGPGTNYPVVGSLQSGETVDVQGCTGSWCQVSFSGGSGFASQSYLAMAGGVPSAGVAVTEGYAPGYAYSEPSYGYDDDYYGYGYDYGPSVGVFVGGGRFHNGHRYDHRWGGRPGGWQGGRTGVATGTWQGRPGGWQGRGGFSGNRVGGAAPGSVAPVGRGGPTMSAPTGLGGARMGGGGGPRMGGGGGAHIGGGGGAHVGGGGAGAAAGGAIRR